jgi:osmoprotectant transport system substrate-binding protein
VGAFDFPESEALAEIYATAMNDHGYPAEVLENVASREIMEPALEQGKVDFVPEYLGTALSFVDPGSDPSFNTPGVTQVMLRDAFAKRGVTVLDPAPAQNRNEIAVTRATADRYHLTKISDLEKVAGQMNFGGPPECPSRPHCLGGLQSVYGLKFEAFVPLDAGGPLTIGALRNGEINVALLFTTTPQIDEFGFVVLRDDRHLQPSENVVPVVRDDVLSKHGSEFRALVDRITRKLTEDSLRGINRKLEGRTPSDVAQEWLFEQGLES